MSVSPYIRSLRQRIGNDLLLMPAVTGIVINDAGEVLLHRSRDDGKWYLVGGSIDPGEEPAQACAREVLEETGLVVVPERITEVHTAPLAIYPNGDRVSYVAIVFRCRPVGGELRIADDESLEVKYFKPDALPQTLAAHHKRSVAIAFADSEAAVFVPARINLE